MTERPGSPSAEPADEDPEPDWSWVGEVQEWVPPTVDVSRPSIARIYDFGLGGKDNYPVDRAYAEEFLKVVPDAFAGARANRAFLLSTVRELADAGIDQFLDLGSGLPTSPSVHETAREHRPAAAVVYVDNDPVVLAHNRALLIDDERVATLDQDIREPRAVLSSALTRRVLDLKRPVGVLLVAVLHFVDVASAPTIVARYVRALAPGSLVAITATSTDGVDPQDLQRTQELYLQATGTPLVHRTRVEIEQLFEGTELLRPLTDVFRSPGLTVLGGIGVKR